MQKENNKQKKKYNKTRTYKHVKVNKVRPKLSKGSYNPNLKKQKPKPRSVQKDKNAKLNIIPLGGLDAIGDNMTVFEDAKTMILDDAGMMFPNDNHPGVDLILPDYTYVLEHADKLRGIVITHGHEDHIGCLPYLIQDLGKPVPIYATKLAIGFIKAKFEEFDIKNIPFNEIKAGDVLNIGDFQLSFFKVNHSIPGAVGIFLQTPAGNVLHTGDFKLDQTPIDGRTTDFNQISKYAKIGVDLLMSDSTNATEKGYTPSESSVGPELEKIIKRAPGKVIIATFASHIHRVQQAYDAAVRCGRKVVVAGRSMVQNVEISRKLGYLHVSDDNIIDAYELDNIPPKNAVILCTGSQGEPLSALSRIADDSHKRISVDKGDVVIMSATPVPGNEKAVSTVVNKLAKLGVDVYDKKNAPVHVSGHASAEELKMMLSLCEPYGFIPVHGEAVHLLAHAKLAESCGVAHDNIYLCDNGDVVELSTSGLRRKEPVQSGVVFVDGLSVGDTSQDVLQERNFLGEGGIAVISAAINLKQKQLIGPVFVNLRGVSGGDDEELNNDLRNAVVRTLNKDLKKSIDVKHLRKSAKDSLLALLWDRTNQRPMVIVNLIEV